MYGNYQNQVSINICNKCHHHPCVCNKKNSYNNIGPNYRNTCNNNYYYYNTPSNLDYINNNNCLYSPTNTNKLTTCNKVNNNYNNQYTNYESYNNQCCCNCNKCKKNQCNNNCCNKRKCGCNGLFWLALALLII